MSLNFSITKCDMPLPLLGICNINNIHCCIYSYY